MIKPVIGTLGILAGLFLLFLIYSTIRDYRPQKTLSIKQNKSARTMTADTLRFLAWNIGYAGLGEEMSFFYDGGEEVRISRQQTENNLEAIQQHLRQQQNIDFYLLQEVDKASKRSYFMNEFDSIKKTLTEYSGYLALNYKVPFVPLPPTQPMGKVTGGLATFAAHNPKQVTRYQFPGNYPWPKSLFMLDRCFMVSFYDLPSGKELLVINTHNSAYDDGGLKQKQMNYLRKFILKEYQKGNYLVVGGDWNQYPPGITSNPQRMKNLALNKTTIIENDFLPNDWQWVYDPGVATNRSLKTPLKEGTDKAIIDFYLVSPNISVQKVKTQDLKFQHSDHQPVFLEVSLN